MEDKIKNIILNKIENEKKSNTNSLNESNRNSNSKAGASTEKNLNQTKSNRNKSSSSKERFGSAERKAKTKRTQASSSSLSNSAKKKQLKKTKSKHNKLVDLIALSYQDGNYATSHEHLGNLESEFNHNLANLDEKNLSISLSTSIIEYDNPDKNLNLLKEKIREINDNFAVVHPLKKMEDFQELNRNYFRLININAPVKKRFENFKKEHTCLSTLTDKVSEFEFFMQEEENYYKENPDVKQMQTLANYHISNESTLEEFFKKLDNLSSTLHQTFRPNWDDYFMKIAHAVSDRSNCMKQRIGALLVKDLRIISTGYNGMSSSLGNCYLGNCPRCNIKTKQGENLHNCICIHAEESAVSFFKVFFKKKFFYFLIFFI